MNAGGAPLVASIRGPIMLIALGTLFAVDHLGAYEFCQTWPVLIILFGVLKLIERTFGSRPAGPAVTGGNLP